MAAEGKKYVEICEYLNQNHYDSILEYYEKNNIKRSHVRDIGERLWSPTTVMEILFNEVYLGKLRGRSDGGVAESKKIIQTVTGVSISRCAVLHILAQKENFNGNMGIYMV